MAEPADVEIGERVHTLMWRAKVSQVRLASQLGVTQAAVSKKVRGDRPWFASELLSVAAILGVPVTDLLPDTTAGWAPRGSNPQPTDYKRAGLAA